MRKIKFRALHEGSEVKWLYGSLYYNDLKPVIQREYTGVSYVCMIDTEGQFTGFEDESGKDIYEGDILCKTLVLAEGYINRHDVVCWDELAGCWVVDESPKKDMTVVAELASLLRTFDYYVVGNIYEDKHLLNL